MPEAEIKGRPEEITDENLLTVDINVIAVDQRFPQLKFENSKKKLTKIQRWILEAEFIGLEPLIDSDKNEISQMKNRLKEFLQNLLDFDKRTTSDNAQQEHDSLENNVDHFFNDVYRSLANRMLPFLRQDAASESSDTRDLEKEQQAAAQAKKEFTELKEQYEKELSELKERRSAVEKQQGELVAVGLGKDFDDQATTYAIEAAKWLGFRNTWFWVLFGVLAVNVAWYLYLFISKKFGWWPNLEPGEFFTLGYGAIKITVLALLSYAVGFSSRNYNINMGLEATNRHRKNVAETLLNALGSNMPEDTKSEFTRVAATAMVKPATIGYISKEHQNDSGPILQIVKDATNISGK